MVNRLTYIIVFLLGIGLSSCAKKVVQNTAAKYIHVSETVESNKIQEAIVPYRGDLQAKMSQVVGVTEYPLVKGKPNAPLGNYLSDLLVGYARKKLGLHTIDFAIFNNGGFRIPLPGDSIRVETLFELMPFENELVWVELPADSMYSLSAYLIKRGGEPVSNDMKLEIIGGKVVSYTIRNQEINREKTYYILTSDYLSGGGDNMSFFKGMKVTKTGVKLRDAIIEAMRDEFKNGLKATSKIDNRLTIEP